MDFANKGLPADCWKSAVYQLTFYFLWEGLTIFSLHFLDWLNTKKKVYGDRFVKGTIMLTRFGQVINKMRYLQGRIQDFKLGGAHLKKLRRAEGGAKNFGVFRVKNHDFTPKFHIFSNFRGSAVRAPPPLDPPLICSYQRLGNNRLTIPTFIDLNNIT